MKYVIKGGQWRNTEDEILKAAVMKYTLNQWSRISSLLKRPAEECKARWYEWLDPSIRKTEWTKEEEEKLLHLVKVFPSQWRTIAPIVGRTQAQCVEHYEKLLNQEQGKTKVDENDPRKLQPGEIDPNPETRPARPDPIDMDEDEKQMLAEARARLPNTSTKKKNRKLREKRLEEARRLADIQKKRELKAAGIDFNIKKKIRVVDCNQEVPFERAPLQLEYATGPEEDPQLSLHFANISLQTLEGTRRDEEEQQKRKLDEKIIKKFKGRDMPRVVTKLKQLNNSLTGNKTKLVLPSPQLKDKDLEEMGKLEVRAKPGLSEIRKLIQSSLLQLPKPKNDYEVEILEVDTLEEEPSKKRLDAEEQDALDRKNNERLAASSQSARKNLPRPYKPSRRLIDSYLSRVPDEAELRKEAETLLAEEMLRMTTTDRTPLKDIFTEKDILEADKVLKEEMLAVKELLKLEEISKEDLIKEWEEAFKNVVFDDDKQMFIDGQNLSREFKILCAINEFKEKKDRLEKDEINIETLQKKAGVSLEGYPKTEKQIQREFIGYVQNTDQCLIETEALKQVRLQEQRCSYLRMDELKELCEQLDKKEVELQKKHNKLLREREEAEKEAPAIHFI